MHIIVIDRVMNSPHDTELLIVLLRECATRAGFIKFYALNDW